MQLQELARGDLTMIRSDDGPNSQSHTLIGYATVANVDSKTVDMSNPLYRSFDGSKRLYRCQPDNFLAPGDTVQINGEEFTAGLITYTIGPKSELMEISEA